MATRAVAVGDVASMAEAAATGVATVLRPFGLDVYVEDRLTRFLPAMGNGSWAMSTHAILLLSNRGGWSNPQGQCAGMSGMLFLLASEEEGYGTRAARSTRVCGKIRLCAAR